MDIATIKFPEWAKITYNGVPKRIANPKTSLLDFKNQILKHYSLEVKNINDIQILWDNVSLWESCSSANLSKSTQA